MRPVFTRFLVRVRHATAYGHPDISPWPLTESFQGASRPPDCLVSSCPRELPRLCEKVDIAKQVLRPAVVFMTMVSAFAALSTQSIAASETLENEIKATFVYKFAPFVSWPQNAFAGPQAPLTICVAGHDAVGDLVDQATAGQSADQRPIVTKHLTAAKIDADCRILYVASSDPSFAAAALAEARRYPLLTITDADGGARGMINFVIADNHVRFDIDEREAAGKGLSISSKLLGLARQIVPKSQERAP